MKTTPAHQFDTTAHAAALQARRGLLPFDALPSADILDSWARCLASGLDSAARTAIDVVDGADLARRRERAEVTRLLAQAELETLAPQIAGSNFLLAFADAEGVILDLYADNRFAASGAGAGIVAGSRWSEQRCGTNGLGTALATGRAIAVAGLEHYLLQLRDISCTAAPVRDAFGAIVGVLDASSYYESRQRHTQALVQMASTHIENGLLLHQLRQHLVLAIHPRPEFLGTLGAGLLAFDDGGKLLALNARAGQLLHGLAATPGTPFDHLFATPFEQMLARVERGGEMRLRDALGSTLVASCVHRPPARRDPRPAEDRGRVVATLPDPSADADVSTAAARVAAAMRIRAPVLIEGETGTGKEFLARRAHAASGRRGDFVAIHCGALPAALSDAGVFGGGAVPLAGADGGTLLLEAVNELPPAQQAALLRFLDDPVVQRSSGAARHAPDVQVLATTRVDLESEVAAQRFRADLLQRLQTVRVRLPPLRLRRDFAAAARCLLHAIDPAASIDDAAVEQLSRCDWPGNFIELRAMLTHALLSQPGRHLCPADLPAPSPAAAAVPGSMLRRGVTETVRRELERCRGSVSQAARRLGISRTTVYRHLRRG